MKDESATIMPLGWEYEAYCLPSSQQVGGTHYKDMVMQPSDFIDANQLNWYEGNAIKYICRHKVKGGKADIEKAIHYLQLLLEKHYS